MSEYKTGTASVTNGSNVVNFSGSTLVGNVAPGHIFTKIGSGVEYVIASVVNNTQATLTGNYGGATESGVSYTISTGFTSAQNIPYAEMGDTQPATILKRMAMRIDDLITSIVNATNSTLLVNFFTKSDLTNIISNLTNPRVDLLKGIYKGNLTFDRATPDDVVTYVDVGVVYTAKTDELRMQDGGILVEGPSNSGVTYSKDISQWTLAGAATRTTDGTTGPDDAATTAYKITGGGAASDHILQSMSITDTGQNNAESLVVKGGDISSLRMRIYASGGTVVDGWFDFDTSTGTISGVTNLDATFVVEQLTNGWWRIGLRKALNNTGNTSVQVRASANAAGYFYLWHGQIEDGKSYPSSIIISTTAAQARAGDSTLLDGINMPDLTTGDYSMLVRFKLHAYTNYGPIFGNDAISITSQTTSNGNIYVGAKKADDSTYQYAISVAGTIQLDTLYTAIVVCNGSTLKLYINGIEKASTTWESGINKRNHAIGVGCTYTLSNYSSITIYDAMLFNYALTPTEAALG